MISLIPKDMSPIRVTQYFLGFVCLLNRKRRPWSLFVSAYHLIMIVSMGILAGLDVIFETLDVQQISQALSVLALSIQVSAKAINVIIYQEHVEKILDKLDDIRNEIIENTENVDILKQSDIFLKKIISIFALFFSSFPTITLITNFLVDYLTQSENPHLVFQVWIPWDMKEYWPYVAGMIASGLFPYTSAPLYGAFSILQLTFSYQISAFTQVLQARLERYGCNDKNIKLHCKIIELINEFNRLFSGQMYLEICLSSLLQCGYGYTIVKAIGTKDPNTFDLIYKSAFAILVPYLTSACGQEIYSQVEKLHESAYMSDWYERKPKERFPLITMMTVTVHPITLCYRKFVIFNFVCFATVVQAIYSYQTMIYKFDSGN